MAFMKIEFAYSTDTGEVIDTELAYDYFWAGIIKDKRNFQCLAENCTVDITCANLDKPRQDMKYDPYYKAFVAHSDNCEFIRDYKAKMASTTHKDVKQNSRANAENNFAAIFEQSRPRSHYEKLEIDSSTIPAPSLQEVKSRKRNHASQTQKRASHYYSIRALVSKYLEYRKEGVLDQQFVNIRGYNVSYNDLFVEVDNQDFKKVSKYQRIYFGKAFINPRKDNDYAVTFSKTLSIDETSINPSTYLSDNTINSAFTKKLYKEKFKILSEKKYPSAWAFIYGTPTEHLSGEKKFININISNMDYFDLREQFE